MRKLHGIIVLVMTASSFCFLQADEPQDSDLDLRLARQLLKSDDKEDLVQVYQMVKAKPLQAIAILPELTKRSENAVVLSTIRTVVRVAPNDSLFGLWSASTQIDETLLKQFEQRITSRSKDNLSAEVLDVQQVLSLLTDAIKQNRSRYNALTTLNAVARNRSVVISDETFAAVVECLDDESETITAFCCGVNRESVRAASETVLGFQWAHHEKSLESMLDDESPTRRASAVRIMTRVRTQLSVLQREAIIHQAADPDVSVKVAVAQSMAQIKAFRKERRAILRTWMVDEGDELLRREASLALAAISRTDSAEERFRSTLLITEYILQSPEYSPVLAKVRIMLKSLTKPQKGKVAERLATSLDRNDWHLIAQTIAAAGTAASATAPELDKKLRQSTLIDQQRLAAFRYAVDRDVEAVLPTLREGLQSNDRSTKQQACLAIRHLESDGAALVPELIQFLKDDSMSSSAISTLAAIGPAAKKALPEIRRLQAAQPTNHFIVKAIASIEDR